MRWHANSQGWVLFSVKTSRADSESQLAFAAARVVYGTRGKFSWYVTRPSYTNMNINTLCSLRRSHFYLSPPPKKPHEKHCISLGGVFLIFEIIRNFWGGILFFENIFLYNIYFLVIIYFCKNKKCKILFFDKPAFARDYRDSV